MEIQRFSSSQQGQDHSSRRRCVLSSLAVIVFLITAWTPQSVADEHDTAGSSTVFGPVLNECPPPCVLKLDNDQPGLICCPDQDYVLCAQSSCTLLAGVAICECLYIGKGVSLAVPYSSYNNPDPVAGKELGAPWTGKPVSDVCQYMEDLREVHKVMSTYNPLNYNYHPAGSYLCENAKGMIWAQCDGAICQVVDDQGNLKTADHWQPHDRAICTCQAVQRPGVMPGPVLKTEDGFTFDRAFAQKYCGSKPKLDTIDYPENGVHISLLAAPELLATPLYQYLMGFYQGRLYKVTETETQVITQTEAVCLLGDGCSP